MKNSKKVQGLAIVLLTLWAAVVIGYAGKVNKSDLHEGMNLSAMQTSCGSSGSSSGE